MSEAHSLIHLSGLPGAPETFQAVIEDMLQVLDAEDVMAYLDFMICFHSGFEENFKGIGRLLKTIRKAGFKLSGKKYQFVTISVMFLDKDGIRPQPEKLGIIQGWKALKMKLIFSGFWVFAHSGGDL